MEKTSRNPNRRDALRSRAVAHLKGSEARLDGSPALRVLYDLASSPSTAPDALALLHELQVHQVEVDLQDEELRRSRAEMESSLNRQVQLYDYAPVGCFTLDFNSSDPAGIGTQFPARPFTGELPDGGRCVDTARDAEAPRRGCFRRIRRPGAAVDAGRGDSPHARLGLPGSGGWRIPDRVDRGQR